MVAFIKVIRFRCPECGHEEDTTDISVRLLCRHLGHGKKPDVDYWMTKVSERWV